MSAPAIPDPAAARRATLAWLDLAAELGDAVELGRSVPCLVDPDPFTSNDRGDRLEAAAACSPCPALVECARFALANGEPAWVWAGLDLTPRPGVDPVPIRAELEARAGFDDEAVA